MNAGRIAQIGEDVFDFAEWNEVTQGLLPGIEPHTFPAVFGEVSAKQFFGLEPGGEKVHVVHERVGYFGLGKNAGKLRLPDPLGKPSACWTRPKMLLEIAGEARDLLKLVFGRDGDENGLVEAAADEFNLATLDQFSKAFKIFGAMLRYPGEQRTGIMKTEANLGMFFQALEKGEIGIVVRFLKDVLEIAARLVSVNEKSKMESLRHGRVFSLP
jgi:hypothetical protein